MLEKYYIYDSMIINRLFSETRKNAYSLQILFFTWCWQSQELKFFNTALVRECLDSIILKLVLNILWLFLKVINSLENKTFIYQ